MNNNFSEPESEPETQLQPEPDEDKDPKIYLEEQQLSEAVFDASMFIAFQNEDQRIRQHLGNPQIFHTEVTKDELQGHFLYLEGVRRKNRGLPPKPLNDKRAKDKTAKALAVFDSTYLHETPRVKAIAGEIIRCLQQKGIKKLMGRKLSRNDLRDIETMAYAMAYGMDAVAADKLFYTIGRMFQSASTMHVNRKKNSPWHAIQILARLEKQGFEISEELTIKLNSSEDVRRAVDEKAKEQKT